MIWQPGPSYAPVSRSASGADLVNRRTRTASFGALDPSGGPSSGSSSLMGDRAGAMFSPTSITSAVKRRWADWAALAVLAGLLYWSETAEPFQQIIQKEDMHLYRYPLKDNTVPSWSVPIIGTLGPLVVIIAHNRLSRGSGRELSTVVMGALLAVFLTALTTNLVKICVGRPRPSFAARCWPDGEEVWSSTPGVPLCSGSAALVKEGRKSFPSGHASWSFAGMFYLTLYLSAELEVFGGSAQVWRILVSIAPCVVSGFIALSRFFDYWHHWQDIAVGSFLGCAVSWVVTRMIQPSLLSRSPTWEGAPVFGNGPGEV